MDGHRPGLDLKFFENICPDQNVPVIAVFTKYDQYLYNVEMDVLDDPAEYQGCMVSEVAEERFQEHYLCPLGNDVGYVRLEKMNVKGGQCGELVEKTAAALNENAVMLMLLAVQKGNVELSVKTAWRRVHNLVTFEVEDVIKECLFPFPYIWLIGDELEKYKLKYKELYFSLEKYFSEFFKKYSSSMSPMTKHIIGLHTIQNVLSSCYLHFLL